MRFRFLDVSIRSKITVIVTVAIVVSTFVVGGFSAYSRIQDARTDIASVERKEIAELRNSVKDLVSYYKKRNYPGEIRETGFL